MVGQVKHADIYKTSGAIGKPYGLYLAAGGQECGCASV
jgi:hypothetical protein